MRVFHFVAAIVFLVSAILATYASWFRLDLFRRYLAFVARINFWWHKPSADWIQSWTYIWIVRIASPIAVLMGLLGVYLLWTVGVPP